MDGSQDDLDKVLAWENQMMFDLHSHTLASDGKYSPTDLVNYAKKKKVDVLAITDHDTCSGVEEAIAAGKECGVHIVSGIEISTMWRGNQIHIVGLAVDIHNPELNELITTQAEKRLVRAKEIGAKLEKCGFADAYERTKAMAAEGASITRGNYAAFLYSLGVAPTIDKCFQLYLGSNCRAFVKSNWGTIADAINAIKAAGGIAVLAHPRRYDMNNKWLRNLIKDFKECGGEGIEVSGAMQAPAEREFLVALSKEYGLMASCGSDFHREKPYLDLGGNLSIPENASPIWHHERFKLEA